MLFGTEKSGTDGAHVNCVTRRSRLCNAHAMHQWSPDASKAQVAGELRKWQYTSTWQYHRECNLYCTLRSLLHTQISVASIRISDFQTTNRDSRGFQRIHIKNVHFDRDVFRIFKVFRNGYLNNVFRKNELSITSKRTAEVFKNLVDQNNGSLH